MQYASLLSRGSKRECRKGGKEGTRGTERKRGGSRKWRRTIKKQANAQKSKLKTRHTEDNGVIRNRTKEFTIMRKIEDNGKPRSQKKGQQSSGNCHSMVALQN